MGSSSGPLGPRKAAHQASATSWLRTVPGSSRRAAYRCAAQAMSSTVSVAGEPVRDLGDHSARSRGVEDDAGVAEQVALAAVLAVGGVGLLPGRDRVLVVAGERGEGGVGDAVA